jgi:2-polyprenyl-6-methoxyphenol hydroxylase-like FAD-dependent oxidoreductase
VHLRADGVDVGLGDGGVEGGGFLVGADGVRSRVRQAVMGEAAPSAAVLASASWRFMAPNPGVDCWTLWAGPRSMIVLIPVDGGEVYGWCVATKGPATASGVAALGAIFEGFPRRILATVDAVLANPSSIYHSPLEEIRIPSWSRERVVLIGDAAHATAPVWAQGAALALEDALILSDLLVSHGNWASVGRAYEQNRRPRVGHVQAMTDRMSRAAQLPNGVRNLLMPLVGPRSYNATYGPLRAPET